MEISYREEHKAYGVNKIYSLPDGREHREDGPAYIREYVDGTVTETWLCYGKVHRYGGPASYDLSNERKEYYVHDKQVSKIVNEWLSGREYGWETMSDIEKWELDLFMRTLG